MVKLEKLNKRTFKINLQNYLHFLKEIEENTSLKFMDKQDKMHVSSLFLQKVSVRLLSVEGQIFSILLKLGLKGRVLCSKLIKIISLECQTSLVTYLE